MTNPKYSSKQAGSKTVQPFGCRKKRWVIYRCADDKFFVIAPPGAHQEPDEYLNNHCYFQLDKLLQNVWHNLSSARIWNNFY